MIESIAQDLRLAARALAKSPGFTITAAGMIALGVGANTALFGVVSAVLLRPPQQVDRPDRLVSVYTSDFSGPAYGASSYPDYLDYRDQTSAFVEASALRPGVVSVPSDLGPSETVVSEFVTGNYFELLGVEMALGRGFTVEEADPTSGAAVVVLGHGFWTRRFGADPGVIGTALRASGQSLTIVGVAPEGFGGLTRLVTPELWVPLSSYALIEGPGIENRGNRGWVVVARLADGATPELAQEQLTSLAGRLGSAYPEAWTDVNDATRRITLVADVGLPPQLRNLAVGFGALLLAIFFVTLMIACANIANLMLARASRRKREVAMKLALGASRIRILRQLLVESAVVATLGGLAGVGLALWALGALRTLPPIAGVEITLDLGGDSTLVLFSAFLTLLIVLAVGLAPAVRAMRTDPAHNLKGGRDEGAAAFRWLELRNLLVVAQVAASLVLLVGAGLLLKSVGTAVRVDPGFDVDGLATLSMSLGPEGRSAEGAIDLFTDLSSRVARMPGVASVAYTSALPLTPAAFQRRGVSIPGYEPSPGEDMEFQFHAVGPGFMETLGMQILRGREFTDADDAAASPAVIVNESFAERFWPGEDPVGKLVRSGPREAVVVGLVGDALYRDLQDVGRPAFFLPVAQSPSTSLTLVARTSQSGVEALLESMRAEVAQIDARLPVATLQTMNDAIATVLLPQRIASSILSIAGALGMLLAAAGLYSVMTFVVAQRTKEIGLRMALGARGRDVVRGFVGRGMALAAAGVGIGVATSALAMRLMEAILFQVSPLDPAIFSLMGLTALAVAGVAAWVPARRASTVDPMVALRSE